MKKTVVSLIGSLTLALSCAAAPAANAATISGAETGAVYVWKASSGSGYKTIVNNGTYVSLDGGVYNGRIHAKTGGGTCGWFTARYVRAQISGAETGAVYVWSSSSGSGYKTIVNNGTTLRLDSGIVNGRIHGTTSGGISGWFTRRYVR